ncbi:MAG: 50S ribosomal protein L23 [uncultured bacterium]|nr:MAG: 50S ribosomal protein L23 [uncultured bacterium]KKU15118.1 MAG: 50S ribosomal protein L23 [Microgenomates group bacterium GW2011_GWC2_45_8]KKU26324.1 MAG: 50S ribosomal protein L23 [Microgenomates group bacterium GW2011_GWA2_46_16]
MTLIKPIITEKSMSAARNGHYTFKVEGDANKHQVKEAVETTLKVNVTGINISRRHVPGLRTGAKRLLGSSNFGKYAVVKLKSGQSIDLFDLKDPPAGKEGTK